MVGNTESTHPFPLVEVSPRFKNTFWRLIDMAWDTCDPRGNRNALLALIRTRYDWHGHGAELLPALEAVDAHLPAVIRSIHTHMLSFDLSLWERWESQLQIFMVNLVYRPSLLPPPTITPRWAAELAWIIAIGKEFYNHYRAFDVYFQVDSPFKSEAMRDMATTRWRQLSASTSGITKAMDSHSDDKKAEKRKRVDSEEDAQDEDVVMRPVPL